MVLPGRPAAPFETTLGVVMTLICVATLLTSLVWLGTTLQQSTMDMFGYLNTEQFLNDFRASLVQ